MVHKLSLQALKDDAQLYKNEDNDYTSSITALARRIAYGPELAKTEVVMRCMQPLAPFSAWSDRSFRVIVASETWSDRSFRDPGPAGQTLSL